MILHDIKKKITDTIRKKVDKVGHVLVSSWVFLIIDANFMLLFSMNNSASIIFSALIAFVLVSFVEIIDKITDQGKPEIEDIIANAIGIIAMLIIVSIF